MKHIAILYDDGNVTIPAAVLQQLGLEPGDFVEFCDDSGTITIRRLQGGDNPFAAYVGILGPMENGMTSVEWVREMRDDEDRRQDLAEASNASKNKP
jgi:AbrB family looped-hinge helix DNA binding protein